MTTAYYDHQPDTLAKVGNGSYLYRYNINEETNTDEEGNTTSQWSCNEVTVWKPLSANKITQAVLTDRWDADYEQKLVNEYNAAEFGILTGTEAEEKIANYKAFLEERKILKAQVDSDCAQLGIK